jgi:hypothetical protein
MNTPNIAQKGLKDNPLPDIVTTCHYTEFKQSAIHDDLIRHNFKSVSGDNALSYLTYALPDSARTNTGRLRQGYLYRYSHISDGGWWCNANSISDDYWGCLKPDHPISNKDGKVIKYEHPTGVETQSFKLNVSYRIGLKIATKHGLRDDYIANIKSDLEVVNKFTLSQCDDSFWSWVLLHPTIPLVITEGAKKAAALLSKGFLAIALPGVNNGYKTPKNEYGEKTGKPYLIPDLQVLLNKNRDVIIAFDQDAKVNTVKNVSKAIITLGKLLTPKCKSVSVMGWNNTHKGVDDLIFNCGNKALNKAYQDRISLHEFKVNFDSWLDSVLIPDITLNQRYLDINLDSFNNRLIAVKSAKGTGKTEILSKLVSNNQGIGKKTIVIVHRIQLGRAISERLGLVYHEELKDNIESIFGCVITVDSLYKLDITDYEDCDIIIDEADQVLHHTLLSNTCKNERTKIFVTLSKLLDNCDRLFLASADLDNITIDYFKDKLECEKAFIIQNTYKVVTNRQCYLYTDRQPTNLVNDLINQIKLGKTKHLVHLSGQTAKSKYSTQTLEKLINRTFSDLKVLRIDSESVANPTHAAYGIMGKLDTLRNYDIILASPTIETGVSIDIKGYFDGVWAISWGIQTTKAVLQSIERLRDDISRYLWVNTRGLNSLKIGSGDTYYSSLMQQLSNKFKLLKHQYDILGLCDHDSFLPEEKAYCKIASIINKDFWNYRARIISQLTNEGYQIICQDMIESELSQAINNEISDTRDSNYETELISIIESEDISNSDYDRLQNQRAKTDSERYSERKHSLKLKYPEIELTTELIKLDNNGIFNNLKLHYYLTTGKEYLPDRDKQAIARLNNGILDTDSKVFKPDIIKSTLALNIAFLDAYVIPILDREYFTQNNLTEWHKKIISLEKPIREYLGIRIDKSSAIACLKQFITLLGFSFTSKQVKINSKSNKKERRYYLTDLTESCLVVMV